MWFFSTQYLFHVGYPCSLCGKLSYNSDSWDHNAPAMYVSSQHPWKLIIIIFRQLRIVFVSYTQCGKYWDTTEAQQSASKGIIQERSTCVYFFS